MGLKYECTSCKKQVKTVKRIDDCKWTIYGELALCADCLTRITNKIKSMLLILVSSLEHELDGLGSLEVKDRLITSILADEVIRINSHVHDKTKKLPA